MLPLIILAIMAIAVPYPASAQLKADQVYTLTLTGADVAVIAGALAETPYKTAQPVLEKLVAQTKEKPPEPPK